MIHRNLQTKTNKKAVLWQGNRAYDAVVKFDVSTFMAAPRGSPCDSTAFLLENWRVMHGAPVQNVLTRRKRPRTARRDAETFQAETETRRILRLKTVSRPKRRNEDYTSHTVCGRSNQAYSQKLTRITCPVAYTFARNSTTDVMGTRP